VRTESGVAEYPLQGIVDGGADVGRSGIACTPIVPRLARPFGRCAIISGRQLECRQGSKRRLLTVVEPVEGDSTMQRSPYSSCRGFGSARSFQRFTRLLLLPTETIVLPPL
jgi:hypothetical protein